MKFFLDTEFYEDGTTIDLISIALISETGTEFYAVSTEAKLHRVSAWVRKNVLPSLPNYGDSAWMTRAEIASRMMMFVNSCSSPDAVKDKPEFWAYYADYDWVTLCQLFGTMMDLPSFFPKFCMDLKQLSVDVGSPKHSISNGEHNALADARWNRDLYQFLMNKKSQYVGG